jgi:hypothetical protein
LDAFWSVPVMTLHDFVTETITSSTFPKTAVTSTAAALTKWINAIGTSVPCFQRFGSRCSAFLGR